MDVAAAAGPRLRCGQLWEVSCTHPRTHTLLMKNIIFCHHSRRIRRVPVSAGAPTIAVRLTAVAGVFVCAAAVAVCPVHVDGGPTWQVRPPGPGGYTTFRSCCNRNMLIHPDRLWSVAMDLCVHCLRG